MNDLSSWIEQIHGEDGSSGFKSIPGCCIITLEWAESGGLPNVVEKINENMSASPISFIAFRYFNRWIQERENGRVTKYGSLFNDLIDKASEGDFK
jgi:hypothetical protein